MIASEQQTQLRHSALPGTEQNPRPKHHVRVKLDTLPGMVTTESGLAARDNVPSEITLLHQG